MSRHSSSAPKTVADLVEALGKIDQSLPVIEGWDGIPGWFEVDADGDRVTIGVYLDSCYSELYDAIEIGGESPEEITKFGGLELPENYDPASWPYGD